MKAETKTFTSDTLSTVTLTTLDSILKYPSFDPNIFSEESIKKHFSIYNILNALQKSSLNHITDHISANLLIENSIQSVMVLTNIIKYLSCSSYIIRSLAKNSPTISSFIHGGLTTDILDNEIQVVHKEEILALIESGLMTRSVRVHSALRIFRAFPFSLTKKLISNIGSALVLFLPKVRLSVMNDLFGPLFELGCGNGAICSENCKLDFLLEVAKTYTFKDIHHIIRLDSVKALLLSHKFAIQSSIMGELVAIITFRPDLTSQDKCMVFSGFMDSYPATPMFILMIEIRDFMINPENAIKKSYLMDIISIIIKRDDLRIIDKVDFLDEIVRFYPENLIHKLFRHIRVWLEGLGKIDSLRVSNLSYLVLPILKRSDFETYSKTDVIAEIAKEYSQESLIKLISDTKGRIARMKEGHKILPRMIFILSLRKSLTLEAKRLIFQSIVRVHDADFMAQFHTYIRRFYYGFGHESTMERLDAIMN